MKSTEFFRVHLPPLQQFFFVSINNYLGGWTDVKTEVIGQTCTIATTTRPYDVDFYLLLEDGDFLLLEDGDKIQTELAVVVERLGIFPVKTLIEDKVIRRTRFRDTIAGHTLIKDDIVAKVRMPG